MLSGALDSILPRAEFTVNDIIDEVHALREENAALKKQVAILSSLDANGTTPPAARAAAAAAAAAVAAASANVGSSSSDDVETTTRCCLAAEVKSLEGAIDLVRLQGSVEREELALRCEELGRALEQRVLQAERAQHDAVAQARQSSRAQVDALEEQLAQLAEELAQKEALSELYGASAHQAAAAELAAQWEHKFDRSERECARLRQELETERAEHGEALAAAEAKAAEHAAEAESRKSAVAGAASVKAQLESQLVRLSEGFNKQVEEVLAVQKVLQATRESTVDKASARSWVVNFVEATTHGGAGIGGGSGGSSLAGSSSSHAAELLNLMAEWWEFSKEDRQRVGLSNDLHPSIEAKLATPTEGSLTEAFASFLDDEAARDREEALIEAEKAAARRRGQRAQQHSSQPSSPNTRSPGVRAAAQKNGTSAVPAIEPPEARSLLLS